MGLIKKFFEEVSFFGGVFFYLSLVALFYILGKIDYSIILILAFLFIYFVTFIIRLFYFKPRPEKISYNNFVEKMDASSFPSIHAARITFLTLFFMFFFTLNYIHILIILIIWFLTTCSRSYLKKHDLPDLIAGIILGGISLILLKIIIVWLMQK